MLRTRRTDICDARGLAAALLIAVGGQAAVAQDVLYTDTPPDDAIFVRSFIDTDKPRETTGLPAFAVDAIAGNGAAFSSLSAAEFGFSQAGGFYALLADAAGAVHLVPEPARADRAKVYLTVLNASDADVRLVEPTQGLEVVAPTPPLSAAARAVNPVDVRLAVESAATGEALASFDLRLRRGQNVTFLVRGGQVELIEDAYGPVVSGN
ncbi:hypothetical protein ACRDNQ_10430 [Palleronia sp. KMU-117]|uniref:hypothetical protein n=1 Tax=Palleronia sp. KMU-117 TaxID=3434108 RepID=UPI003D75E499